jgi:hypothetical protein
VRLRAFNFKSITIERQKCAPFYLQIKLRSGLRTRVCIAFAGINTTIFSDQKLFTKEIAIGGCKGVVGRRDGREEQFQTLNPTPLDRVTVHVVELRWQLSVPGPASRPHYCAVSSVVL